MNDTLISRTLNYITDSLINTTPVKFGYNNLYYTFLV